MGGVILTERLTKRGTNGRFGADPVRRAGAVRQPSLLELVSLEDWPRFVPETLGLLLVIAFIRYIMDASSPGASSMPHAFWIPVLLMAAQYGIMGGLFAASSASLLYFAIELPAQSAAQDFYDYAAFAAVQPCAWFAAALVLGGLRTLHMHHQTRLADRLEETEAAAEELAESLTGAAREMDLIEQRIAADTATTSVLLGAFAEADLSSRQALLASFARVFRHGAGADSFAVYLWDGDRFAPRFGFEDGAPIPRAALASLAQLPGGPSECGSGQTAAPDLPLRVAIRISDAAKPIGCTVCTRLAPGQSPIIVVRRLKEVCRVLAKLLVVCPEDVPGAGGA
jgi:hypothetical protein